MDQKLERWRKVAVSEPKIRWQHRSEIIAHFIRPGDVVCELGAGARTLRRYLPHLSITHLSAFWLT